MSAPFTRLIYRIGHDFALENVERVISKLSELPQSLPSAASLDPERIQAAVVISARGDYESFVAGLGLAQVDWRDALVNPKLRLV